MEEKEKYCCFGGQLGTFDYAEEIDGGGIVVRLFVLPGRKEVDQQY